MSFSCLVLIASIPNVWADCYWSSVRREHLCADLKLDIIWSRVFLSLEKKVIPRWSLISFPSFPLKYLITQFLDRQSFFKLLKGLFFLPNIRNYHYQISRIRPPRWPKRLPRERKIRGSNSACDGIYPCRVISVTQKLALQWIPCQTPGVIGSALGLVGPVSVYCD